MLLTDAGAPMQKLKKILAEKGYKKTIHLLCMAHAMNNVACTVRKCYPKVDEVIMKVKKIFQFSHLRNSAIKHAGLKKPPAPVETRWGTWLKSVSYYADQVNRRKFVDVLKSFQEKDGGNKRIAGRGRRRGLARAQQQAQQTSATEESDVETVIRLLEDESVWLDIEFIDQHLKPISQFISKIEQDSMNTEDFFNLFHELEVSLRTNNALSKDIVIHFQKVIDRNDGLISIEDYFMCKFAKLFNLKTVYFHFILLSKKYKLSLTNMSKILSK